MAANQAPQNPPADVDVDDDEDDWGWARDLQILLLYNGRIPDDRIDGFVIPDHTWTVDPKPLPFPLSLDSTWYLGACLALLLAVHLELDTGFLRQDGYAGRILAGVGVPVAFAALSMVMYDIFGVGLAFLRRFFWSLVRGHVDAWYHQADGDGHRPWYFPEEVLDFAVSSAQVLTDCGLIVGLVLLKIAGLALFELLTAGYAEDIETTLSDEYLAQSWLTAVANLGPKFYWGSVAGVVGWEVVPQFLLQICIASSLYWTSILLQIKSQEALVFGRVRPDPLFSLLSALVSAVALHLVSGTAYQGFHLAFGLLRMTSLQPWLDWSLSFEVTRRFGFRRSSKWTVFPGILVKAALLYGSHNVVGFACRAMATVLWPLWRPLLVLLTIFVEAHIQAGYPEWQHVIEDNIQRVHRRHYIRAAMTILFGAVSSWPMPARLFQ